MKRFYVLFAAVFVLSLAACDTNSFQLIPGPTGATGAPGTGGATGAQGPNGHSLVSQYVEPCQWVCPNGGSELDIYLDTDDTLSVSEGDTYQNSIIACNGANGLNGQDGLPGTDGAQGEPGAQGPQGNAGPQGPAGADGVTGPTGAQGPAGPQGPAGTTVTITAYTSSSCTLIAGTTYYAKNSSGTSGSIYDASSCASNHKVGDVSGGDNFWLSATKLATDNNGSGIRVVSYQ